jgi:hypothetical protein
MVNFSFGHSQMLFFTVFQKNRFGTQGHKSAKKFRHKYFMIND